MLDLQRIQEADKALDNKVRGILDRLETVEFIYVVWFTWSLQGDLIIYSLQH